MWLASLLFFLYGGTPKNKNDYTIIINAFMYIARSRDNQRCYFISSRTFKLSPWPLYTDELGIFFLCGTILRSNLDQFYHKNSNSRKSQNISSNPRLLRLDKCCGYGQYFLGWETLLLNIIACWHTIKPDPNLKSYIGVRQNLITFISDSDSFIVSTWKQSPPQKKKQSLNVS